MSLCLHGTVVGELKAVKSDIDQIFVQKEVLTVVVREDDHEALDEGISQHRFHLFFISLIKTFDSSDIPGLIFR